MIGTDEVSRAYDRISGYIRRTPVVDLAGAEFGHDTPVNLKLELLQHGGSFKARGAFNNLLSRDIPPNGVAAASGGNHGVAVAYAAGQLGHRAEVFVPSISSPAKIERIKELGAVLHVGGERYSESLMACERHQSETGAIGLHAYDSAETVAGQGTLGLEWEDQLPELDSVLVAVGGAGLISGIATWFGRRIRVIGVEPEGSDALRAALEAGQPTEVRVDSIAADSLGASSIGQINYDICANYVDQWVLVADSDIREAMKFLWTGLRIAAEPGGAAALSALLSGSYRPRPGERVGVLVCGGNIDPIRFAELLRSSEM